MKHSLLKRVLSLVLCLLMIVTAVPISAGAASSLDGLNFVWPVDTSIGFGSYHGGVDFAAPKGTPIYAAESGIIRIYEKYCNGSHYHEKSPRKEILCDKGTSCLAVAKKANGSYANHAVIEHANGYSTLYAHLLSCSFTVDDGAYVEKGQKIAEMGTSGKSTGYHLHFEMKKNGSSFQPTINNLEKTNAYHFEGVKIEVTVDSNYPTNFSATAKLVGEEQIKTGKIPVYSNKYEYSIISTNIRWISDGDPCTIQEVYSNGMCKVTYPGTNGPVDKYYAKIENFNLGDYEVGVNIDGVTRANITAKSLVYPEWIYPGTQYDAYNGVVTSNYPLASVTVRIYSRDFDAEIKKTWKAEDGVDDRVVIFAEDLPIKPEEFAGLRQGNYIFKVSASCNKRLLGIFDNISDEVTIFDTTFSVSLYNNNNEGITHRSNEKREIVANQGIVKNYNSSNIIDDTNNSYTGVSSYPIGTYKVKVNTSLNARKGPGTSYAKVSSYKNGTTVNVTATDGNWGYTGIGWICLDYTTFVAYAESTYDSGVSYGTGNYVVTTAAGLNCRAGVGSNSTLIKTLPHGTQFSVTQTDGAWGYSPENGGWLCLQYASYVSALTPSLPVPALPNASSSTSSVIGVGDVISFKWDAVDTAEMYTVKLIDANTNKEVQTTTVSGTNASFKTPYAGKFNVSVFASNSQHDGPAATLFGFTAKAPATVTFKDWDGKVISTQSIAYGKNATAPTAPSRIGHTFAKWDGNYESVREDRTITATYTRNKYKVTFCAYDGSVIGTQDVYYGDAAVAPSYTAPTGYTFVKWDTDFSNITKATTVKAVVSWTSIYPLEISTSSAIQRNNKSYIVTSIVNNSPNAVNNARIIAVLKTKENKLLATVQSANISLAKGEVKNLTLTASYDGMATKAEIFVVKADDENIPLAEQLTKDVDQGTAWTSFDVSNPPADALQTRSRTEYRYRDKQYTSSTSSSLSGWTLRTDVTNPTVSYGGWSDWSGWQDAWVGSSDTCEVKTQQVTDYNSFTDWGNWSDWQDAWVGETELRDVETQEVDDLNNPKIAQRYHYYRYANTSGSEGSYAKGNTFWNYEEIVLTEELSEPGTSGGYKYKYNGVNFHTYWPCSRNPDICNPCEKNYEVVGYNKKTQYRYRDRSYGTKTQYSYITRTKTTTYYFWKWGDWSNWSTTAVSGTNDRAVETRTTYSYIPNKPSNIETTAGNYVERKGSVDKAYAGRQALLFVTDKNGTVQFVGQSTIGSTGSYAFKFKTREEPTLASGDYSVLLSIEGATAAIVLESIKAPVPEYTVKFVDYNGTVVSTQTVKQGEDASAPATLSREGYRFIGWDKAFTNIQSNTTLTAQYEIKTFDVVFVDEINDTSATVKYNYGDTLTPPEVALNDAYNFLGWDAVLVGKTKITESMVVTAKFEKKMYTVDFLDFDGSLLESQTVEYGEPAIIPELKNRDNYVFICWDIPGDTTYVTESMTIEPYYEYTETVATPVASIENGTYSGIQTVTLSCATEGAQIYYTTDGSDPLEEIATYARARSVQLNGTLYTGPFELDSSSQLLYTAVKDGMNASDYDYKTLAINTASTETKQYTVTIHHDMYDSVYTILVNEGDLVDFDEEYESYGYTLEGVYTDAAYTNAWDLEKDTVKGELDLYYKWTKDTYTVTFEDMNGDVIETQTVEFGDSAVAPQWPEIENYIFTGWNADYSNIYEDTVVFATYVHVDDITTVEFEYETLKLIEGDTHTIEATVDLGYGCENDALIWQSSNEDVVIVDDDGKITALTAGTAIIFAISEESGMSAQCEVTVTYKDPCAVLGHEEEEIPAVAATCTETGLTAGKKCSVCGIILTAQTETDALGHTDEIIPAVAPTCTKTGLTEGLKCNVCDEILVKQTVVAELGHTEEVLAAVASTCTATGLTEGLKCTVCDEILIEQNVVEKIAHDAVLVNYKESIEDKDGYTGDMVCAACGEMLEEGEIIPGCKCTCHRDDKLNNFFNKIIQFFRRLFGINSTCECGTVHTSGLKPFWAIGVAK